MTDTDEHNLDAETILKIPYIKKGFSQDQATAEDVYAEYFQQLEPYIVLNKHALYEAVASAYCDIFRLKAFRGIIHADRHKRAAFLIKWIAKLRPIYVYRHPPNAVFQFVNELFAVTVAMSILNIKPAKILASGYAQVHTYVNNLVYLLHYHACAPEQLASELFLLEQLANGRR